jgi:hypothetical protein
MDDGYQQQQAGIPDTWLTPNEKFPSGLASLSSYIQSKGLKPGIWTYTSFHQKDFANRHKDYFVLDKNGKPAKGFWVGYSIDGSNKEAIDSLIRPVYSGFTNTGWSYFKVDALRHLRYEGYNSNPGYFTEQGIDPVEAYRNVVMAIREEIGSDRFMLGCWGVRPELTGIIDGCRIGGDGFGYAGLAQYNSFNNVVWRNDPDHIELSREEAYRSCMVTSLTGSLFMLTDKPEVYLTDIAEPARRSVPVLITVPGQIFDVDPSRSIHLDRVNAEVSGNEERLPDANRIPVCNLYLLEINKSFEDWVMLGITNDYGKSIHFPDLGLDEKNEYLVFEFWSKHFLGVYNDFFTPGRIDTLFNCQLFCIRAKKDHPQLLATSRHITCGGFELKDLSWDGRNLSGISSLVAGDPYLIYIYEPDGFLVSSSDAKKGKIVRNEKSGNIRILEIRSKESQEVYWKLSYELHSSLEK